MGQGTRRLLCEYGKAERTAAWDSYESERCLCVVPISEYLETALKSGVSDGVDDVKGYDTTNGSTGRTNKPSTHDSDVCHFTFRVCCFALTRGVHFAL